MGRAIAAIVLALSSSAFFRDAHAQARPGQTTAPSVVTLAEALERALDRYPSIKASLELVNVSTAEAAVASASFLPRLDTIWQSNRATTNNVFGQVLPQSVIPAMSGPALAAASAGSVWGTATGGLFSWEAADFGSRRATVRAADAAVSRARADEALTRHELQSVVGGAFFAVLAAERAVTVAEADVARRDVLARVARTLADNELRPGAEASRADAERAAAETRRIQAHQALVLAETTLARWLGVSGVVAVDAEGLLALPPGSDPPPAPPSAHPLAETRRTAVDVARSHERILALTDRPRVFLQSSVFARGSGANPSGVLDGGVDGLGLERANWAAGVHVVFPNLFDFTSLRARQAASAAATRAEMARHDEAILAVTSQQHAAAAMAEAARAVAANAPIQLAAARQSETQARARYDAGLATIIEVAEAQHLLAQAEFQDAIARVDVWRALLAEAAASGNLAPFVDRVRAAAGAR